jgi:hypothetical protein
MTQTNVKTSKVRGNQFSYLKGKTAEQKRFGFKITVSLNTGYA